MEEIEDYLERSLKKTLTSSKLIDSLLENKGINSSFMNLLKEKNELLEVLKKGKDNKDRRKQEDFRRFIRFYKAAKSLELSEVCLPPFSLVKLFLENKSAKAETALVFFAISEINEYLPEVFSETDYYTGRSIYDVTLRGFGMTPFIGYTDEEIDEKSKEIFILHYSLYEKVMDSLETKLRADQKEDLLIFFENSKLLAKAGERLPYFPVYKQALSFRNLLMESVDTRKVAKQKGIYKQRVAPIAAE